MPTARGPPGRHRHRHTRNGPGERRQSRPQGRCAGWCAHPRLHPRHLATRAPSYCVDAHTSQHNLRRWLHAPACDPPHRACSTAATRTIRRAPPPRPALGPLCHERALGPIRRSSPHRSVLLLVGLVTYAACLSRDAISSCSSNGPYRRASDTVAGGQDPQCITMTPRATAPPWSSAKPSLIWSRVYRRLINSSSFKRRC
jgi:hypothetical protein